MSDKFPKIINDGGCGIWYVLADTEREALTAAVANWGDEVCGVGFVGWMGRVPYPDRYESREEWEQSAEFTDEWWEGMQDPVNDKQRTHLKQAWSVQWARFDSHV